MFISVLLKRTDMERTLKKLSDLLENVVSKNDTRSLKTLLKGERYDVEYLERALVKAAETKNMDVVQLLLDHVVESWFNVTNALLVVFSTAAKLGRDEFMRLTVAIKLRDRSVPSTALRWAAEHGQSEWIKPLLDNGADVNWTVGGYGHTALHAAAVNGHVDCLTTLIEHGADVNAGAGVRRTPLHFAARRGHTECVTALLRHGADVNSRDRYGRTPLHWAAMRGRVECFKKLVQSGADTTLRGDDRGTALDVAKRSTKQQMQYIVKNFLSQKSSSRDTKAKGKPKH